MDFMSTEKTRPSRRAALLGDRPGSYAIARHVRMTPTKVRRVVDLIRGMAVNEALVRAAVRAAGRVGAGLQGARLRHPPTPENAEASRVRRAVISAGVRRRRPDAEAVPPAAKGRRSRINKRASHITVVVEPKAARREA
jgi:large subunit ribosomal protein L22